jgi:hypothetical protein
MNKNGVLLAIVLVFVAACGAWYFVVDHNNVPSGSVACTQEAKECPDGSYVGRIGSNCEFAACPNIGNSTSTVTSTQRGAIVEGIVLLGPICPVERIPPDPNCAPKPYQTSITISKNSEPSKIILTIQSNASGTFNTSLPIGKYVFYPTGGSVYPRCDEKLVDVIVGINNITINCDTGIR